MKGVYTVERKEGSAVYVSYTPPGEQRIRERVELVPRGRGFGRRLRDAERRAEKVLVRRKAAIVEGRHEIARPKASMRFARFVETIYAPELRDRGIRTAKIEIQRITTGPVGRYFGAMRLGKA